MHLVLRAGRSGWRAKTLLRVGLPLAACSAGRTVLGLAEAPQLSGFVLHRSYAKLVSFPLAQTGEGISECELVAWAVKAGDTVSAFDKLCDVQSDKASIEITSRYGGRVVALHCEEGAVVKVGAALLDLEVADDVVVAPEHLAAAAAAADLAAAGPGTTTMMTDTVVAAPVAAAAVPSASSSSFSSSSTSASSTSSTHLPPPAPMPPAAAAMPASAMATPPPPPPPSLFPPLPPPPGGAVHAAPAVRALARELGLDVAAVAGTGPGGRVTKPDLLRHKDELQQQQLMQRLAGGGGGGPEGGGRPSMGASADGLGGAAAAAGHQTHHHQRSLAEATALYQRLAAAAAAGPVAAAGGVAGVVAGADGGGGGDSQVLPLKGYRRAMVKSMTAAAALPNFHFHDEVALDRLLAVRAALKNDPALRAQGIRLTLLPFIVKALSAALLQHPQLNASLAPSGTDLLLHPHHNIGVAMSTPSGLVVPNIKQVQRKSVAAVAAELSLLQQLAAAGRLPAEALAGGTISISNIGTIGGTYATPLVSPPEVAIVALGRLQLLPRYPAAAQAQHAKQAAAAAAAGEQQHHGGGEGCELTPVPVSIMPVSWGADHRVVDGAALAAFSNSWKALLEAPERLLLTMA